MKFLAAAGLAGAFLATSPVFAADLDSAPPPLDAPAQSQEELGANWYIRGDVGYGSFNEPTVSTNGLFPSTGNGPIGDASSPVPAVRGNNQTKLGATIDFGVGYRINDWFRVEGTYTFSQGPGLGQTQRVYCPQATSAVNNFDSNNAALAPIGYAYDYTTCDGRLNVSQYNNTALAMGYVDIGRWSIFSPYIGAGVGMNVNTMTGKLTFNSTDTGQNYAGVTQVTGTAPYNWVTPTSADKYGNLVYNYLPPTGSGVRQAIGPANWDRTINQTKYTIAASAAAGVGIQISQSATLDVGYHITTLDLFGGTKSLLQSVNVGVRYNLN